MIKMSLSKKKIHLLDAFLLLLKTSIKAITASLRVFLAKSLNIALPDAEK